MPFEKHLNKLLLTAVLCLLQPVPCMYAERPIDEEHKLSGTVIGTEKCYNYASQSVSYDINIAANAFDGNLSTFVATYETSHTWVGLDLGYPHIITRVGWSPRNDSEGPKHVVLGIHGLKRLSNSIKLSRLKEVSVRGSCSKAVSE